MIRDEEEFELIHDPDERVEDDDYRPEITWSKEEQRWAALGALKGALLIALVYLAGLGAVIWLLLHIWM